MTGWDEWKREQDESRGQWVERRTQECAEERDEGYSECTQTKDEGYQECSKKRDKGYHKCTQRKDKGRKKCDGWGIFSFICIGWVWISNIVCVARTWISNIVCVAWTWISNIVCVARTWISNIVCVAWTWVVDKVWVASTWVIWGVWKVGSEWIPACLECFGSRDYSPIGKGKEGVQSANKKYFAQSDECGDNDKKLTIKFLGTNSIYITDGITHLMIDPYFTRPSIPMQRILLCERGWCTLIRPDKTIIEKTLSAAHIERLDAILTTHSHYDHALDVVEVWKVLAEKKLAPPPKLVGSKSIGYIGHGGGIPDDYIEAVDLKKNHEFQFDRFTVKFFAGEHIKFLGFIEPIKGEIKKNIVPPARLDSLKQGAIYNILIEHPFGSILNQGSAAYSEGGLDGIDVDYLILGIAAFDLPNLPGFKEGYFGEVMKTDPKRIFFSHWDHFGIPLDQEPEWVTGVSGETAEFFRDKKRNSNQIPAGFLPLWEDVHLLST